MQQEYNVQYADLLKRLTLLKIKSMHETSLKDSYFSKIDLLLKDLDWRYSEGKQLDSVDFDVESLEARII